MTKLALIKRRSLVAVIICGVLAISSIAFWQMNQGAQAAMIYPHAAVGWWRFDEGSGTVAEDSSGYRNDGTLLPTGSKPQWVDGIYGGALSFDGDDDKVVVPKSDSLNFGNAVTVCAWIESYSVSAGDRGIVERWNDVGLRWFGDGAHGRITGYVDTTAGTPTQGQIDGDYILDAGVWYHVAFVWTGSQLQLYVNGSLHKTKNWGGNFQNSGQPLQIGKIDVYATFNGIIDDVRVYSRALSAAEIQESFQKSPDFSSEFLAKIPKGTTQVIATLSWQGIGDINVTIETPHGSYTEDMIPVYQKAVYSTSGGTSDMLNIKRLSVSIAALSSDENWRVILKLDNVEDYRVTVEIQK